MTDAAKQKIVRPEGCICVQFRDTGGFRIADLTCPVHGVDGGSPGDGYWETEDDAGQEGHVTTPPPVPPQAITAALQAAKDADVTRISSSSVRILLEAAAPHLAAAEREACAQLADSEAERIDPPGSYSIDDARLAGMLRDFADLLRKDHR